MKPKATATPKPVFFPTAADFRRWLEKNHASATELYIGFYKAKSGKTAMTYEEAVDESLCFGWIDGVVKSLGPESYQHRFSPRKPTSIWSMINIGHVARLTKAGKMHPRGLAAFAARKANKVGIYAYEQRPQEMPDPYRKTFKAAAKAWAFWEKQPPGYRRTLVWWIISAKQEATRDKRLKTLIKTCAAGRRVE
ncbi:MAG: YdeI/OmpD-associated family protein [Verrucomicrobiota bacterium]